MSINTAGKQSTGQGQPKQTFSPDQVKSISGGATAELNYASSLAITGPQLTFDKNQLCMKTPVSVIAQDQVVVKNVGTTTITYDWRKVMRGDFIQSKKSDFVQRFYCHYPHGILKPGEQKTFTFSFRSAEKPGMYFEEWELITDPFLLQSLPLVYLSGIATLSDQSRQDLMRDFKSSVDNDIAQTREQDAQLDLQNQVVPQETSAPDLRNPEVFKQLFEQNNSHLGLYFSMTIMSKLFELIDDVVMRSSNVSSQTTYDNWNGNLDYVENLLTSVSNPYTRQSLKERYLRILSMARKVPTDRAQSYPVFKNLLLSLSEQTVDFEQKARDELQTIANHGFFVPNDAATLEELKKLEDERKAKKADWYKTTKKKPKTEDEELQEAEEIKHKAAAALKNELLHHRLTKIGRDIDILKTKWVMENHTTMDRKQYDDLYHLESVLDIDVTGKDLIVRLDLDVPLSTYTPTTESQSHTLDELQKSQPTKDQSKSVLAGKKGGKQDSQLQHIKAPEEPWKKREIMDHTLIKRAANEIRYLQQERMANRTFILANLADKAGRIKPENSMRIIKTALQKQISDSPLVFIDDAVIADFEHKLENEAFPEQTTYILENLNFKPDEFGYVEPEKLPEEPKPSEDELRRLEEEKQKELLAQQAKGGLPSAKGAPPAKAPAPVDKKKEEEAKKKLEEELAAKKKAEETAATQKSLSEEERAEIQRQKEEADRKKREAEFFDYRTIHKYKEFLGRYGEIYVNDAPIATLTGSNSIAEIKCKRKVLGVKITEELRKICLFFLKKHPKDITDIWYQQPNRQYYHTNEFTAVIGGTVKSVQEILDRILLVNALLDTCKSIYLGGQFGLAALNALGVKVGNIENQSDFDATVEFFKTLFSKAIENKAMIYFPRDLSVTSTHDIEQAKQEQIEYESFIMAQQVAAQSQQYTTGQKTGKTAQVSSKQGGVSNMGASILSGGVESVSQSPISEKPARHWVDRLFTYGKVRDVKLRTSIATLWNEVVSGVYDKYCERGMINRDNEASYSEHPLTYEFCLQVEAQDDQEDAGTYEVKSSEIVLEFSEETLEVYSSMIRSTFKLFIDGSLSPYDSHASDSLQANNTNKILIQTLLDLRVTTQNDDEPPVTLLHGSETESVVKKSLLRIKVEQQEEQEEQKRRAREAKVEGGDEEGEDEEEEEPDEITMTQADESFDQGNGSNSEMGQIADFHCYDIPAFTTKVMQGVINRSLLGMSKHQRKPKERVAEDLFLLDEI